MITAGQQMAEQANANNNKAVFGTIYTNVKSYGAKGDWDGTKGTDDSAAIQKAMADATGILYFPSGSYKVSSPIKYKEGILILGQPSEGVAGVGTRIIVNGNNFLDTNSTIRVKLLMRDIDISGSGIASTDRGITGKFGGVVENCRFTDLGIGINNPEGYFTQYINNDFTTCGTGILSAVSNAVTLERGFFNGCLIGADFGSDSAGLNISNCGINLKDNSLIGFKVSGGVSIKHCYGEGFGTPNAASTYIAYSFSKFGNKYLSIKDNDFNGSSKVLNMITLTMDTSETDGYLPGEIKFNHNASFLGDVLKYGANNDFQGVDISQNNPIITPVNRNALRTFKPMTSSKISTGTSIAGATYIVIPLNGTTIFDNVDAFSTTAGRYRTRQAGIYKVSASVICMSTASDYNNINIRIVLNGAEVVTQLASIKFVSNPTYAVVTVEAIISCATAQDIGVSGRNGDTVQGGTFICELLRREG